MPVMYRLLFTNRWVALAFVAILAVSAIVFVSTSAKDIDKLAEQGSTGGNRIGLEPQPVAKAKPAAAEQASAAPSGDDSLIDQAAGTDPTPSGDTNDNDDAGWGSSTTSASAKSGGGDAWAGSGGSSSPPKTNTADITGYYPPGAKIDRTQGQFTSGPAR